MDLFAFKNRKRQAASRRLRRLLDRRYMLGITPEDRRGDTRSIYPRPACVIPLKDAQFPILEQRQTVFLCDLSGIGIGFYAHSPLRDQHLILCLRNDMVDLGEEREPLFVKMKALNSIPCEEGYYRVGCEIIEEVDCADDYYAMLPLALGPSVQYPELENVPPQG